MMEHKTGERGRRITRHIPNSLTGLRILCAGLLLFFPPASAAFWTVYLSGGATDLLDGFLARRLRAESAMGAALDSGADLAFLAAAFLKWLPRITLPLWAWLCMGAILMIRLVSLILHLRKNGRIGFLHSTANRLTGLLLFAAPLALCFFDPVPVTAVLEGFAAFSAIDELWQLTR